MAKTAYDEMHTFYGSFPETGSVEWLKLVQGLSLKNEWYADLYKIWLDFPGSLFATEWQPMSFQEELGEVLSLAWMYFAYYRPIESEIVKDGADSNLADAERILRSLQISLEREKKNLTKILDDFVEEYPRHQGMPLDKGIEKSLVLMKSGLEYLADLQNTIYANEKALAERHSLAYQAGSWYGTFDRKYRKGISRAVVYSLFAGFTWLYYRYRPKAKLFSS